MLFITGNNKIATISLGTLILKHIFKVYDRSCYRCLQLPDIHRQHRNRILQLFKNGVYLILGIFP